MQYPCTQKFSYNARAPGWTNHVGHGLCAYQTPNKNLHCLLKCQFYERNILNLLQKEWNTEDKLKLPYFLRLVYESLVNHTSVVCAQAKVLFLSDPVDMICQPESSKD